MRRADDFQEIASGVFYWSVYADDLKADLSCSALIHDNQLYFFDPIKLRKEALDELVNLARPAAVILTSETHARDALFYQRTYTIPVYAHSKSIKNLSSDVVVDFSVEGGDVLYDFLDVIHLPGTKEGECAYFADGVSRVCIIGDALINMHGYGFDFLPKKYCDNAYISRESLRKLTDFDIQLMLFAHGKPLISDVNKKLSILLEEC